MKKGIVLLFVCLTLTIVIFTTACEQEAEELRVYTVSVIPAEKIMIPNKSLLFRADVWTVGGATQDVEWSLDGVTDEWHETTNPNGTRITQDGVLFVGPFEEEGKNRLKVVATSIHDYPRKRVGQADVEVLKADWSPSETEPGTFADQLSAFLENPHSFLVPPDPTKRNFLIYIDNGEDIINFRGFRFDDPKYDGMTIRVMGSPAMGTPGTEGFVPAARITWRPHPEPAVGTTAPPNETPRALFDIGDGFSLVLEDIILISTADTPLPRSNRHLIVVREGGKLEIIGQSVLTNRFSTTASPPGGNSAINIIGGNVIMHGGTIERNTSHGVRFSEGTLPAPTANPPEGTPCSINGEFTMFGGTITNNQGHGVLMGGNFNTFTMRGGTISHHQTGNRSGIRFPGNLMRDDANLGIWPHDIGRGNEFIMHGGFIINNDFGIRIVCSQGANQEYTKDSKVHLLGGTIGESSRHQFQAAGAPGLDFEKSAAMIINATSTARIQIRDMQASDIADYRDGPQVRLTLKIESCGNRWVPGSFVPDANSPNGSTWRLLRTQ
jgi:hypothetical protein